MKLAYLLLASAACSSSNGVGGGDDYQVIPGGVDPGHSGGGPGADASVGDGATGDGGPLITGRICILDDLRSFGQTTTCATGGGGLNVRLDGQVVLTSATGTFQIAAPTSSDAVWKVDDGTADLFVTTFMPYAGQTVIPIVTVERFRDLQATSQITLPAEGAGSVLVRVLRAGAPLANVTGTVSDTLGNPTVLYDGTAIDQWANTQTGAKGLVLFAGVSANPNGAATPASGALRAGATTTPLSMTVWDQAITFLTKVVP